MVDVRRRGAAELAKAERYGCEGLARSLVPALDAMDALTAAADDAEGARLTQNSLLDALRSHGISRVSPEVGETFDVDTMEAMYTVPTSEVEQGGTVADVLRSGYLLHGERLLRAAQVGVAKLDEQAGAQGASSDETTSDKA